MTDRPTGQLNATAADFYEEYFVAALFGQRTAELLDVAQISAGDSVLDVGCGTGILARAARERVGDSGTVIGIDRNDGMIATARRVAPQIEWHIGQAEFLPFDDAAFDHVISQFALMFFDDRAGALEQMWRVTKPGGRLTVAVWDCIENTPGYAAMTRLDARLFGDEIAQELLTPYSMGDKAALMSLFAEAGVANAHISTHAGLAQFDSLEAWVDLDLKGWTLGEMIGAQGRQRLLAAAREELQQFVQDDGSVAFSSPSHVVTAVKT